MIKVRFFLVLGHFKKKTSKIQVNQSLGAVITTALRPFFVSCIGKCPKMLVYFCEVIALQSPSGSDKAKGFEPSKTGKAGLYFSIISVNAKSYNPSIEKRRGLAYNKYGFFILALWFFEIRKNSKKQ